MICESLMLDGQSRVQKMRIFAQLVFKTSKMPLELFLRASLRHPKTPNLPIWRYSTYWFAFLE